MFKNIKVGDKVYTDNSTGVLIFEVAKVGRKYIYIAAGRFRPIRYNKIDGYHSDTHCRTRKLYPSLQALKDENEKNKLDCKLQKFMRDSKHEYLSLEQLRRIFEILEE